MTVTGRQVVAFSAGQPTDEPQGEAEEYGMPPGTPMLLQVSMVTTVARPMASETVKEAIKFLIEAKDTVKDTFEKGKKFYDDHDLKGKWKALKGVGGILGGIYKMVKDDTNPVVKELIGLTKEVEKLSEKLSDNFNEMKSFISEQSFYHNIVNPTSVLTKHLIDCLDHPGEESKEYFRKAYESHRPLELQYNLESYLDQKSTNPLRLNVDREKIKMKETFEKWEDIICRVMVQFFLLEAFATGLLEEKRETNLDRLISASLGIFDKINFWRDGYEKGNTLYWTDFKEFVETHLAKTAGENDIERGEVIKKKLESYLTADSFFMLVLNNDVKLSDRYGYHCGPQNDQYLSVNKGGCNCMVYRSHTASKASKKTFDSLQERTTKCFQNLDWDGNIDDLIKKKFIPQNWLTKDTYIAVFSARTQGLYAINTPRVNQDLENPLVLQNGPGAIVTRDVKIAGRVRTMVIAVGLP